MTDQDPKSIELPVGFKGEISGRFKVELIPAPRDIEIPIIEEGGDHPERVLIEPGDVLSITIIKINQNVVLDCGPYGRVTVRGPINSVLEIEPGKVGPVVYLPGSDHTFQGLRLVPRTDDD